MEEVAKIETLTPYEAGKMLGKNAEFIRALLRQGRVNWGTAVAHDKEGGKWNYLIIKSKFLEFIGVKEVKTNEIQNGKEIYQT